MTVGERPDLSLRTGPSKLTDHCLLWTGYVQPNGYAKTSYQGRPEWAHRAAWQKANGPIPEGMWVLHRCDVPLCINPDHLFLGTHRDNMADMRAKGRSAKGRSAKGDRSGARNRDYGTTCKRGHDRTTHTLYQWSNRLGRMTSYCGRCHADRQLEHNRKVRAS
jgi:hypothetical protein